jgi:hypothetical protein
MRRNVLFRFKIALLATFVFLTLLGMAAPSMKALVIGAFALGVSLVIAIADFLLEEHRSEQDLHSSF